MTKKSKDKPQLSAEGARVAQHRKERLAAALRANLGRRKAQARQRADDKLPEEKVQVAPPVHPKSTET